MSTVRESLIPEDDNLDLGSPTSKWANVRAVTFVGDLTGNVTGNVAGEATLLPTTAGPTSGALTAAMSGRLCIGVVDAVFTLPAPTAGVWYTIVTGVASAGTGLAITATSTLIQGKTTSAGTTAITNATTITNSGATDVVGDYITIRSDGTKWYVVGQSGTYAGS
jgi:hypothetical protein